MNRDLMPCQIEGCVEPGRFEISGDGKVTYLCEQHAEELIEAHKARGGTFTEEESDDEA